MPRDRDDLTDDNFDDNRDDSCARDHHPYTVESPTSCLFKIAAWSWQCGAIVRAAGARHVGPPQRQTAQAFLRLVGSSFIRRLWTKKYGYQRQR